MRHFHWRIPTEIRTVTLYFFWALSLYVVCVDCKLDASSKATARQGCKSFTPPPDSLRRRRLTNDRAVAFAANPSIISLTLPLSSSRQWRTFHTRHSPAPSFSYQTLARPAKRHLKSYDYPSCGTLCVPSEKVWGCSKEVAISLLSCVIVLASSNSFGDSSLPIT